MSTVAISVLAGFSQEAKRLYRDRHSPCMFSFLSNSEGDFSNSDLCSGSFTAFSVETFAFIGINRHFLNW